MRRSSLPEVRTGFGGHSRISASARHQHKSIDASSRLLQPTTYSRVQSHDTLVIKKSYDTKAVIPSKPLVLPPAKGSQRASSQPLFATPRRASWTGGAYASDPLLATKSTPGENCPHAAGVVKRIRTRARLVKTLYTSATEFKQTHAQARVITTKLTELREQTVLLVEALQQYKQTTGIAYTSDSGDNYACELAVDLSWIDELDVVGWLGMWGRGNPFMLPRVVSGKPLTNKPAYVRKPPRQSAAAPKTSAAASYSPFVQAVTMAKIKGSLHFMRGELASSKPRRDEHSPEVVNSIEHLEYAAVELQRCWRGSSVRAEMAEIKVREAAVELKLLRAEAAVERQLMRAEAAVELQRCWRGSVVRGETVEKRMRAEAAVELQRCWRGSVVRGNAIKQHQRAEAAVELQLLHADAAVELQRCWRGSVVRGNAVKQHQRTEAAVELQRCWRGSVVRGAAEASRKWQQHWRGTDWRQQWSQSVQLQLQHAQSLTPAAPPWRKHRLSRAKVAVRAVEAANRLRAGAAVELQRCWRGSVVRGDAIKQRQSEHAAVELQRCWRGSITRFKAGLSAAEALAWAYRHFKLASTPEESIVCRELVFAARQLLATHSQDIADLEIQRCSAAVELQRVWRGSVVRGDAIKQHQRADAALELQRVWRGKVIREELLAAGLLSQKRLEYFLERLLGAPGAGEYMPQVLERGISAAELSMLSAHELSELGFPVVNQKI